MGVVLITGGAGYIGSHAAWAAVDAGLTPVILDDLSTGSREAVPPDVRLVPADVTEAGAVREALREHRPSAVMHFAGRAIAPESVALPLDYYRTNTAGTLALAQACVAEGVERIVFSSTAAVYGDAAVRVDEAATTSPLSPYGWSKLMAERVLADAARAHGLRVVALRYFNVAGADPVGRTGQRAPAAGHLVRAACDAALQRRPAMQVFGEDWPTRDGTGVRDFVHVADLVRAHLLALEHLDRLPRGAFDVINLGSGAGWSVREVAAAVAAAAGRDVPLRTAPRRPGDMAELVADTAKAAAVLGWRPALDLPSMAAHALAWERRRRT